MKTTLARLSRSLYWGIIPLITVWLGVGIGHSKVLYTHWLLKAFQRSLYCSSFCIMYFCGVRVTLDIMPHEYPHQGNLTHDFIISYIYRIYTLNPPSPSGYYQRNHFARIKTIPQRLGLGFYLNGSGHPLMTCRRTSIRI